jgi:hypothetical protein
LELLRFAEATVTGNVRKMCSAKFRGETGSVVATKHLKLSTSDGSSTSRKTFLYLRTKFTAEVLDDYRLRLQNFTVL